MDKNRIDQNKIGKNRMDQNKIEKNKKNRDLDLKKQSQNLSPKLDELKETLSFVLKEAKRLGATEAEANLGIESGLSTTVRLGVVDTVEFNHDKNLGLTVYLGKKKGSVSTSDIRKEALQSSVEAALRIAKYTEEDPYAGLADSENLAKNIPDLDLYHPWEVDIEDAIAWTKQSEDAARQYDARIINSDGASFSTHTQTFAYGNTHGFLNAYPSSRHGLSCTVIGQAGAGNSMQRDYDFTVARDPKDLDPWTLVGQRAAERTLRRLSARKIKTTEAPVIIEASIAGSFIGHLIAAISGGNLYRKSTFLVDSLGKQLFPNFVHIEECPHLKKGLGSAPFDGEGVETRRHDIIRDGILQSYVLGTYSARKLGLKTTGNSGGVHNLLVSHSNLNFEDLIKKMHTGLVVTEMIGSGVNLITGDYSRGAAGFWVENGTIQFPVEEITIAGNLKDLFANLIAIGNDVEKRSNILTGSILLNRMMIAGE